MGGAASILQGGGGGAGLQMPAAMGVAEADGAAQPLAPAGGGAGEGVGGPVGQAADGSPTGVGSVATNQQYPSYRLWRKLPVQLLGMRSLRRLGISPPLQLPGWKRGGVVTALAAKGVDIFEPPSAGGSGGGSGAAGLPLCCDPQAQSWMVEEVCGGLEVCPWEGAAPPPRSLAPAFSRGLGVEEDVRLGPAGADPTSPRSSRPAAGTAVCGRRAPALSSAMALQAMGSMAAGWGVTFGYSWDEAEQGRAAVQEAASSETLVRGVDVDVNG